MLDRVKNPVFARELSRWYKRKPFLVTTTIIYLLYFSYCIWLLVEFDPGQYTISIILHLADLVYYAVSPVLAMTYLTVPVLAATSVVSERRSQTLMLVQLSSLQPFDIVWGKVAAPVVPILFPAGISMLTSSLFLLRHGGGLFVSSAGAVFIFTLAMCGVFIVSAVSVLISTFARSSAQAIILSYAVLVVLFLLLSLQGSYVIANTLYEPYPYPSQTLLINDTPKPVFFITFMVFSFVFVAVAACVVSGFVWWACKRLRLPAKK